MSHNNSVFRVKTSIINTESQSWELTKFTVSTMLLTLFNISFIVDMSDLEIAAINLRSSSRKGPF